MGLLSSGHPARSHRQHHGVHLRSGQSADNDCGSGKPADTVRIRSGRKPDPVDRSKLEQHMELYDARNRVSKKIYDDGSNYLYDSDGVGNLLHQTDAKGGVKNKKSEEGRGG